MTAPRALLNEHPRTTFIGGITCFDIVEVYLSERTMRQLGFVQAIPLSPMRPTHALLPAHGTYFVTFVSPPIYTEVWSGFPFCGRIGDQALRRHLFHQRLILVTLTGSVFSHPYVLPDE